MGVDECGREPDDFALMGVSYTHESWDGGVLKRAEWGAGVDWYIVKKRFMLVRVEVVAVTCPKRTIRTKFT